MAPSLHSFLKWGALRRCPKGGGFIVGASFKTYGGGMKRSQNVIILEHLEKKGGLTSASALSMFRCSRLAARIGELREQGHPVKKETIRIPSGKSVAFYYLEARCS